MPKRMNKIQIGTLIFLLLVFTFLTGCGARKAQQNSEGNPSAGTTQADSSGSDSSQSSTQGPAVKDVKLTLYFPNKDASGLVAVEREVQVSDDAVIKAMFDALSSPPSAFSQALPSGTTLRSAVVKNGVATIDLSSEFQKNFHGGSTAELMTIYSIVDTLTTLPDVQSVQFLLEGKKLDGILGSLDTSVPLKPDLGLISKS